MNFGVVVSSSWSAKQILAAGVAAEKIGLDFFLVTDHYLTPYTVNSVDAWIILSALAANTERIRLGTCVTPIPLRPPPVLAKIIATVDHLSKGRVIVGVGAGWHRPEFKAYSTWNSNKVRVAKTLEGIQLMIKFWTTKDPFDFRGKYYNVKNAILEPKPMQNPHPPFWFGTTGDRMLKIASKYADAWVPPVPGISIETYRKVFSILRRSSTQEGRKELVKVQFNGTIGEIVDNIDTFVNMGCQGVILARTSFQDIVPAMERLIHDIATSF